MPTVLSTEIPEPNQLKLGHFEAKFKTDTEETVVYNVGPLTQQELADGWKLILPRPNKNSVFHHFNVYLSQLPSHLWNKLHYFNNEYYDDVDDKIYTYSVRKSLSDPLLFKLNKLLNVPYSQFYHYDKLKTLYDELYKNHVKGWIMIRTKQLLGL
jgi:hypothetical protein